MKPRQRTLLIAVSCLALACPVKVQIDIAESGGLALENALATAKEGNNSGEKGGGNGNGHSGSTGNAGNNGNSDNPSSQ